MYRYKCNTLSSSLCVHRCIAFRSSLEAALPGIFLPLRVRAFVKIVELLFYLSLRSTIYNSLSLYLPLLIAYNNRLAAFDAIDNSRNECPCNVLVTRFIFNPRAVLYFEPETILIKVDNYTIFFYLNRI